MSMSVGVKPGVEMNSYAADCTDLPVKLGNEDTDTSKTNWLD